MKGGLSEEDALLNVKWLAESGQCDFVEISGGNYENPCEFGEKMSIESFDLTSLTAFLTHISSSSHILQLSYQKVSQQMKPIYKTSNSSEKANLK